MNEIINILKPPKEPLTIKDVQNKLESRINRKINKTMITKFIKIRLNYSFKKGSSTTKRGATLQIKIQQSVFSSRIIKELLNGKYIVNIDESSFNKDIKMRYSWLPKGITYVIINQIHQGSKSMLTAFWSDGEYIWAVINDTVNSQCFQDFLWVIKYFLKRRNLDSPDKTVIMLDNAPYHSSETTKLKFNNLNLSVMFLPPYSPVLAPVEQYFKLIKSIIRSRKSEESVNFRTNKGRELIW